ncbi:ceramidase [Aspergillus affinis]|uniref:ceramidase n=1 Tax=Aspergillus affinis TaxID=1070780 RepID=UPI0022FE71B9|nr:alkaline ceramidase family protein [Aspergillus affinis]KAI9034932.1 alkaline ceramidase family protein [Aspergillus affinis]
MSSDPNSPFWGPTTANSNFCEEDYAITRYIAEFINSLTNISYILFAIHGLRQLNRKSNTDVFRVIPYYGLMAVGICSASFHITMKYHTQMSESSHPAAIQDSVRLAILLGSLLAALVTYHVATDELILHSVSFGVMVVVIGIRTMQLVKSRTEANSAARRKVWGIVRFGAVIFNLGFYIWLIDNKICGILNTWKAKIGLPWAFVLELHGWWHIFTAIGAYIFIAIVDHLVSGEDHAELDSLAWPAPWAAQSIFAGQSSVDEGDSEKKQR